jgi:hypothetical protein
LGNRVGFAVLASWWDSSVYLDDGGGAATDPARPEPGQVISVT